MAAAQPQVSGPSAGIYIAALVFAALVGLLSYGTGQPTNVIAIRWAVAGLVCMFSPCVVIAFGLALVALGTAIGAWSRPPLRVVGRR